MSKENPLVSIICVSYNHEKFVEQGMKSLVEQDYGPIEILYLDNKSADNSFQLGEAVLKNSAIDFKAINSQKNLGLSAAFNYLISIASGSLICIHSLDDWLDASNVSKKVKHLRSNPTYGFVYSYGYKYFDKEKTFELIDTSRQIEGNVYAELLQRNFIATQGGIYRKEVYDIVGGYDENLLIEDWDMSLRILAHYEVGLVKEPLFYYRRHSSSITASPGYRFYEDALKILKKHEDHPNCKDGINYVMNGFLNNYVYNNDIGISDLRFYLSNVQLSWKWRNVKLLKVILKRFFKF